MFCFTGTKDLAFGDLSVEILFRLSLVLLFCASLFSFSNFLQVMTPATM